MAKFSTKAKTDADHYSVQYNRREGYLKAYQDRPMRGVIRGSEVQMHETSRGFRTGVYLGEDGDDPTLSIDAKKHVIDPGVVSTIHRHSWDAIVFVMGGRGWTEINGTRYDWKPWDTIHLPSWAWHRHGNDHDAPATLFTVSCEPLITSLGLSVVQEAGHADWNDIDTSYPATVPGPRGNDPYSRQLRRIAQWQESIGERRLHTSYDDVELLPTKRGSMTTFLVDESIGYQTAGLTAAMKVYAPNEGESMHAHPGEAWLLAVEGDGYTYIGEEPEGGEDYPWSAGDLVVVDRFCWHKHNNSSDKYLARLVRFHILSSVGLLWRALSAPLQLKFEPDWVFDQVKDPTTLHWPDERRPN